MGFQRKRKMYKLDFEGTEWDGLVVKLGGLTTGEYLDFVSVAGPTDDGDNQTAQMIQMLADHLMSWNLEDDGEPIPTTLEGLKSNDIQMNMAIVHAWTTVMGGSEDLEKKSTPSESPLLDSIPTESL